MQIIGFKTLLMLYIQAFFSSIQNMIESKEKHVTQNNFQIIDCILHAI